MTAVKDLLKSEPWLCDLVFLIDISPQYRNQQGTYYSFPMMFNLVHELKSKLSPFLRGKLENILLDISKYQTISIIVAIF